MILVKKYYIKNINSLILYIGKYNYLTLK